MVTARQVVHSAARPASSSTGAASCPPAPRRALRCWRH